MISFLIGILCFILGFVVSIVLGVDAEIEKAKAGKYTVIGGDIYRYVKVEESKEDTALSVK